MTYNPLDKKNLADSVVKALLGRVIEPLPPTRFEGAGVYALYYTGQYRPFALYEPITVRQLDDPLAVPIYVGKAVSAGARIGLRSFDAPVGAVLAQRLAEHAESIRQAQNLLLEDFACRYLVVDEIWIPLAETLLISLFAPTWNLVLSGFGLHDPGSGRRQQRRSHWDVLHPGRSWAVFQGAANRSEAELATIITRHMARYQSSA